MRERKPTRHVRAFVLCKHACCSVFWWGMRWVHQINHPVWNMEEQVELLIGGYSEVFHFIWPDGCCQCVHSFVASSSRRKCYFVYTFFPSYVFSIVLFLIVHFSFFCIVRFFTNVPLHCSWWSFPNLIIKVQQIIPTKWVIVDAHSRA